LDLKIKGVKMEIYNIEEAKNHLQQLIDFGYNHFCPDCLSGLERTEDGVLYCPNEMCLNDEQEQIQSEE
jgi:NAD-dependent DNA ligase